MTSPLEILANVANAASILLATLNRVHTWWMGIIGCALFACLFFNTQLYADALLQLFFIGTSVVGWRNWSAVADRAPLSVRRVTPKMLAWCIGTSILVALAYGLLLYRFTDAYAPFADSAVLALSVVAQLLLMRRLYDAWFFWLAVNTIAVPLFLIRGLDITAALYSAFWINAVVALVRWRRLVAT